MGSDISICLDTSGALIKWAIKLRAGRSSDASISHTVSHDKVVNCEAWSESNMLLSGEDGMIEKQIRNWAATRHSAWKASEFVTLPLGNDIIRFYMLMTTWRNFECDLLKVLEVYSEQRRVNGKPLMTINVTGSEKTRVAQTLESLLRVEAPSILKNPSSEPSPSSNEGYPGAINDEDTVTTNRLMMLGAVKPPVQSIVGRGRREIPCAVRGVDLVYRYLGFRYSCEARVESLNVARSSNQVETKAPQSLITERTIYPYILVNFKQGVSYHLVESPNDIERIGGGVIGASTMLGLASVLCPSLDDPADVYSAVGRGRNRCDMLISDVYGGNCDIPGMNRRVIASSFGSMQPTNPNKPLASCSDIARSLTTMAIYNLAHQSYLNAVLHGVTRMVFIGFYMEDESVLSALQSLMAFWSDHSPPSMSAKVEVVFMQCAPFVSNFGACLS